MSENIAVSGGEGKTPLPHCITATLHLSEERFLECCRFDENGEPVAFPFMPTDAVAAAIGRARARDAGNVPDDEPECPADEPEEPDDDEDPLTPEERAEVESIRWNREQAHEDARPFFKKGNGADPDYVPPGEAAVVLAPWPDLQPIASELRPVPAFDAEALLPDALRPWVMDEAERMPCQPDFIAAGVVASLASVIGARCAMKPKAREEWLVVPNLWGATVGPPSSKKSPSLAIALKPLDRLIAKAVNVFKEQMADHEITSTVVAAKTSGIEARMKAAAKNNKDLGALTQELRDHKKNPSLAPVLRRYKNQRLHGGEARRDIAREPERNPCIP